ncbi:MAG: hypothetical protein ACRDWI_00675 [Jiangellaceae bacterium]
MRSTLTRLAVVIVSLFTAAMLAGGTAHAIEAEPEPVEPLPNLELCFEPDPEDCVPDEPLIVEFVCPPICLDDEETEEPPEEPVDPPAEEPEPQQPSGGHHGPTDPAGFVPTSESDDDSAAQDDAIVAPVIDLPEQPTSGNGALLAVVAAGLGLAAGGGLTYAVVRRRR